jgi:uncharacterized protein (TIGR02646 family)
MRVHGDKKVVRSTNVAYQSNYENYRPDLQKDFQYICGYCGKDEFITCKGFEIDHFVPDKVDSDRKTDYTNLVYSCFTCNRKKSKKWPTCDKLCPNNGEQGFVDPASDEFDNHLGRCDTGEIEPLTPVGRYMCNDAFKFNIRPMKEIWTAMELFRLKDKMYEMKHKLTNEELIEYMEIDQQLTQLKGYLFNCRE